MPLGDTKELALAEGMNDLAANVLFSAAQSCKRLVPARKMELASRKALGSTLCSPGSPVLLGRGSPDIIITAQDATRP